MKNNFVLHPFTTATQLVQTLSATIADDLTQAIQKKGNAFLAVSGGSTPKKLFTALSKKQIAWEKVTVTLVDERLVDSSHHDSNERLIRTYLLQNEAKNSHFIPLINPTSSLQSKTQETCEQLTKIPRFDVVILGMGKDAHTASFFPHATNLEMILNTKKLCCTTQAPTAPKERITLSRSFLLSTSHLYLHIEGEDKKTIFDTASQSSDIKQMPIISMMQQNNPILKVYYAK